MTTEQLRKLIDDGLTDAECQDIQTIAYEAYDSNQGSDEAYGKAFRDELFKRLALELLGQ